MTTLHLNNWAVDRYIDDIKHEGQRRVVGRIQGSLMYSNEIIVPKDPFTRFDEVRDKKGVYIATIAVRIGGEEIIFVPGSFSTPERAFTAAMREMGEQFNKKLVEQNKPARDVHLDDADSPVEAYKKCSAAFGGFCNSFLTAYVAYVSLE